MIKMNGRKITLATAGVLVLAAMAASQAFAKPVSEVTVTGLVTCARCTDLFQHKGFTRYTWAMFKVSQGDDIVLVVADKTYTLQGDREQLTKNIEDRVTVSGVLEGNVVSVTTITQPAKKNTK